VSPPPPPPPAASPPPAAPRAACKVPRLVGKTVPKARTALKKAKCRQGRVLRVYSIRKRGVVVSQAPRAGVRRVAGTRVSFAVSRGTRR
jgi:beta-lactam-binding protein with PASTA domain